MKSIGIITNYFLDDFWPIQSTLNLPLYETTRLRRPAARKVRGVQGVARTHPRRTPECNREIVSVDVRLRVCLKHKFETTRTECKMTLLDHRMLLRS